MSKRRLVLLATILICVGGNASSAQSKREEPTRPTRPVHTFSIVARDPVTGELGVAVQSHWFSVGAIVTWAEAGVGAVATQSFVDPSYGPLGLARLRTGTSGPHHLKSPLARDVVCEREHRDRGTADGKAGCGSHWRQETFEALAAFRQLGGNVGAARMHLDADMVRDQTHDALRIGGRYTATGIFKPARQTVDPELSVRIEHHLDDRGIFEIFDGWLGAVRARYAAAKASDRKGSHRVNPKLRPQIRRGPSRKSRYRAKATSMIGVPGEATAIGETVECCEKGSRQIYL